MLNYLDYVIMDGDMMIYDEDEVEGDDYELNDAISDDKYLWSLDPKTGTVPIPYMVQKDIRPEIRERIERAMSEYDKKTCIRYNTNIHTAIIISVIYIRYNLMAQRKLVINVLISGLLRNPALQMVYTYI